MTREQILLNQLKALSSLNDSELANLCQFSYNVNDNRKIADAAAQRMFNEVIDYLRTKNHYGRSSDLANVLENNFKKVKP